MHEDFPGDAGVFCIYLLNLVELEPGQGIFLAENEPHAYLDVRSLVNNFSLPRAIAWSVWRDQIMSYELD